MHKRSSDALLLLLLLLRQFCYCASELLDLSGTYARSPDYNDSEMAKNLTDLASDRMDVGGLLALEDGRIVAEYYGRIFSDSTRFPLWSGTKSWTGLLFGVMQREGLLDVSETLWDIWPNQTLWDMVEDGELRKQTTIESILQMRAGFRMPLEYMLIDTLPISGGYLGGADFFDSLTYHPLFQDQIGSYYYVCAMNLVSYIIKERTGLTPEQYAQDKIFPGLGITEDDYIWDTNTEGVSLGFHGLYLTTTAFSKLGMLYLQGGKSNDDDEEGLIRPEWIGNTFTTGDVDSEIAFGYFFWIEKDEELFEEPVVFCSKGMGGNRMCMNAESNRVIVIGGMNYNEKMAEWIEGEDAYPQNQLVEMFLGVSPTNMDFGQHSGTFVPPSVTAVAIVAAAFMLL